MGHGAAQPKVAFISGANQGIGRAVATRLAKEYGFAVIIGSRKLPAGQEVADELGAAGCTATAVQLDVTSEASIAAATAAVAAEYGRLDVLINNAGVFLGKGTAVFRREEPQLPTRELFERTFGTNVIGVACLTDALLPLLMRSRGGTSTEAASSGPPLPRIIFVSSRMGAFSHATDRSTTSWPLDLKAYDASKAAVNMLAVNYARILEEVGGSANAVCPGFVSTGMTGFHASGTPLEAGTQRIVELATGENPPTGTFSDKDGPIAW